MSTLLEQASLVLIPSGYKEDVVYSQIPTNGNGDLSFTRASNGTRINSAGLVEVCPWNLLQQSETFQTTWTAINSTISTNATTAPNGTLTADKLIDNAVLTNHRIQQTTTSASGSNTFSVFAKKSELEFIALRIGSDIGYFNLNDGTFGGLSVGITATTIDAGNGWYRCIITKQSAIANENVLINTADAIGSIFYSGTSGGLFIWGAQYVEGSTAKPYFPTTDRLNVPRLTYQNGGGGCPSLLLEPQRTNLLPNQLSYNTSTGVAYNTSVADSPIIGINSARITKNEASGTVRYANQSCSNSALTGSTTYTISAYFKYDGYDFQTSMEYNNSLNFGGTSWSQPINIASTGITLGTSSQCTGNIQNAGNGWYRVSVTITTGAVIGGLPPVTYLMRLPSTLSTGQGFLHAVPQFEQGAYSTTVIPTSGATATRVADSFTRNNIYTNGLITSSGGTWFVELRGNLSLTRDGVANAIGIGDSNTLLTNSFIIRNSSSTASRFGIVKRVGGTLSGLFTTTTDTVKIAIKWNGSTADVFINGTKQVSATAFTATNMEFLQGDGSQQPTFIQSMALYPTPLSDTDCTTLTTL